MKIGLAPGKVAASIMGTVSAVVRSTHPGPSLAVAAICAVLGVGIGLDPVRIALVGAAVLLGHFSVGLSNDWIDAERDRAAGRADKPIATGQLSVRTAQVTSLALLVLAIGLTAPLGWAAALAHLAFNGCGWGWGWGYNIALKSTALSIAAYAVGFGLLPSIATLALPDPQLPAPWAAAAGALIGISAHFANTLPDLADDRQLGVRGMPQLVGPRWSVAVIAISLEVGGVLVVVGPGTFDVPRLAGLVIVTVVAVACWWLGTARPPSRQLFQLIVAAALVIVGLLALSGKLLLA